MEVRALSWNLFHGRDHPPEPELLTWRSRLLRDDRAREGPRTGQHATARRVRDRARGRGLGRRAAAGVPAALGGAARDRLPRRRRTWSRPAATCPASARVQALIADRNPDLIASWEGGSNLTLVRAPARTGPRSPTACTPRHPARAADDGVHPAAAGLCVANLHASAARAGGRGGAARGGADRAASWAAADAADLSAATSTCARRSSPHVFDAPRSASTASRGHRRPGRSTTCSSRGLEMIEPPRQWPPERREVPDPTGAADVSALPDPALRPRAGRGAASRLPDVASRDPVVVADAAPGRRCDISAVPTPTKGEPMASQPRKKTDRHAAGSRPRTKKASAAKASSSRKTTRRRRSRRERPIAPTRASRQFRDALERSVTLSRERIQEVVDDAVKRGRMTARRRQRDGLEARRPRPQADRGPGQGARARCSSRRARARSRGRTERARKARRKRTTAKARKQAERTAGRVAKTSAMAADEPLAQADKLRRRAGVGSSFPITGYDELTAAQVRPRLADLTQAAELRKVRTYEKNNKARKGILDRHREEAGVGRPRDRPRHGPVSEPRPQKPKPRAAPRRGEELELRIDSLAQGGRGVARTDGRVRRLRRRRPARRPGPRPGRQVEEAPTPRRAVGRAARAGARADRRHAASTAASPARAPPGRASPTSASSSTSSAQVAEALERIGGFDGVEVEQIVAAVEQWRYRNKLEYSFGAETRPGRGPRSASTPAAAGTRSSTSTTASSPRRRTTPPATRSASGPRRGLPAYDRASERRRPAQPRRPRGPAHRPDPDAPGHLRGRDPRAARSTCTPSSPGRSGGTEGPTGVLGEERLRERLGGLELRVSPSPSCRRTPRRPSGSTRSRASTPRLGGGERLFDLYCGIGTIGLSMAADAGEVWGIETVAEAIADAEANAELNGIANARFRDRRRPARHPAADRGGGQARRRRHRPAPRRALGEDRPPGARVRGEADRLRLLQPDDDGPERAADGRRRL